MHLPTRGLLMRHGRTGGWILLVTLLSAYHALWPTSPPALSHQVATAAVSSSAYGSGLSADSLYNIPLGGNLFDPPYRVKVSWRFQAEHTALLTAIRPYLMFVDGPGDPDNYSAGDGGAVLIQLQTDDATANHFPSGTVLAEILHTTPKAGGILPRLMWSAPPSLQAGMIYHLVFSNTHPDPFNNFVSLNHLWVDTQEIPRQPTVSDTALYTLVQVNGGSWGDTTYITTASNNTPVFELTYADGFVQGVGYVEVWGGGAIPPISGANQTRETFTVSGPDRIVVNVALRVARISGSDPLTIRLETAAGTLIEQGTIPASDSPLTSPPTYGWVTYTFAIPRTLVTGQSYNLAQTTPPTSVYQTVPFRKAAEYGFNSTTFFADGHAQQNDGSGWVDWLPASWGKNRPDGDLQFFFAVGSNDGGPGKTRATGSSAPAVLRPGR